MQVCCRLYNDKGIGNWECRLYYDKGIGNWEVTSDSHQIGDFIYYCYKIYAPDFSNIQISGKLK